MRKNKVIITLVLFITCSFLWTNTFSQNKNRVGFSLVADKFSSSKVRAGFGVSFERFVNKRNSAEIGIYYRTAVNDNLKVYTPIPPNFVLTEQFFIVEKFISIPLLYNYKSGIVNISVGPALDIYVGWKEKKHITSPPSTATVPLQSYKFDNKLHWGAMAKISKTIKLSKKLLIEPYIYFNPVFTSYSLYSNNFSETRQYYGAALTLKQIF